MSCQRLLYSFLLCDVLSTLSSIYGPQGVYPGDPIHSHVCPCWPVPDPRPICPVSPGVATEGWAPATYLERLSKRHSCGSPSVSSVDSGGIEMRPAASRNSVASNLSVPSEADEDLK